MNTAPPEPRARPYLLSIPAGIPFLDCLAEALLDGGLLPGLKPLRGDPLALSDALIFLPTRRAVRELESIFVDKLGGAAVLPKIRALGTFDEDEDAFAETAEDEPGLKPAIGETERRLVLARLIRDWAKAVAGAVRDEAKDEADLISTSPAEAMSLAIALGQLIDSFETENVEWTKLAGLVPAEHDDVWTLTTSFLNIAAQFWPAYLEEQEKIGGAARRNAQLRALKERFEKNPPQTPVIVAGSTGSNPATAELMQAVARLPNGGVILHGLDIHAGDEVWSEIGGEQERGPVPPYAWTHPQHAFFRLLKKLDVQPGEVGVLGRERALEARQRLVSTALLPSGLTDRWVGERMDADAALDGVVLIEAANEREEALAIAVALRETLEEPAKTAALITPDRPLARRVAAELKRWGVETEDSAGLPLADSPAGILARLVAEAAAANLAPHTLLPLLRHPQARFGLEPDILRRAVDALEIGVLRGPAPPPGASGLRDATLLAREPRDPEGKRFWHPAKARLRGEDWDAISDLVSRIDDALTPLCALGQRGFEAPLADLLSAHRTALAAVHDIEADPDQDALVVFFEHSLAGEPSMGARLADYPALFKTMLRGQIARAARPAHPRLRILGTLEARLLGFDRVVLGGLNEGTWPGQTQNDPFLSRPMRGALGLPPPEWRVGLSAHDFEQALGVHDVVLTRAKKAGGAPSVAARWLQRLAAVAGLDAWTAAATRGDVYLARAAHLDATEEKLPVLRGPAPCPTRELRPRRLSVTEVETLIRDPYAIYAKHVLKLVPLDDVGALPAASDRGNIIHGALAEFIKNHDVHAPDAEAKLIEIGRAAFAEFWDFPDVRALWWPRFERVARWFVDWERKRRGIYRAHTESRGALEWATARGGTFLLAGRADRLDEMEDGAFAVIDYKTGSLPGDKEVRAGFAPQLPLEAAMLKTGGFEDVPAGGTREFVYVKLSGQSVAGLDKEVKLNGKSADEVADERLAKLKELVNLYEDEATPYRSNTYPKFSRRLNGDYDHLARYAEWSVAPEAEDENGDE